MQECIRESDLCISKCVCGAEHVLRFGMCLRMPNAFRVLQGDLFGFPNAPSTDLADFPALLVEGGKAAFDIPKVAENLFLYAITFGSVMRRWEKQNAFGLGNILGK